MIFMCIITLNYMTVHLKNFEAKDNYHLEVLQI